jgi:hypothetical protein
MGIMDVLDKRKDYILFSSNLYLYSCIQNKGSVIVMITFDVVYGVSQTMFDLFVA